MQLAMIGTSPRTLEALPGRGSCKVVAVVIDRRHIDTADIDVRTLGRSTRPSWKTPAGRIAPVKVGRNNKAAVSDQHAHEITLLGQRDRSRFMPVECEGVM